MWHTKYCTTRENVLVVIPLKV